MDNRQLSHDIGNFLYDLSPPLPNDITTDVLNEAKEQLNSLKDESLAYVIELDQIQVIFKI